MPGTSFIKGVLIGFGAGLAIKTVLNYFLRRPTRHDQFKVASSATSQLENEFRVPTYKLFAIVKHFVAELNKGLARPNQTLRALPSFVTRLPKGNETGQYLALDLGGTNLRICEITLEGHGKFRMRQRKTPIPEHVKNCGASEFFDFIADFVLAFLDSEKIEAGRLGQPKLHLGFTFSFPVEQTRINTGKLLQWNKGFEVADVLGQDVVGLLKEAFLRKKLNINIAAIVNDTVGTLVAHAYVDPETQLGVIIGTGTNAAYVEEIAEMPKWKNNFGNKPVPSGQMIVNIEWGAFDNERMVLPVTKYDLALDKDTENPGKQQFEKLISGMYLGEIVRYCIVDLVEKGELFQGVLSPALLQPYKFETQYMSRIERDHSYNLSDTKALLEDLLNVSQSTLEDRRIIKRICELVGIRAARLSAAAIAAVVGKTNKLDGCTVAIDGSVFEHYPHFKSRMLDALREIFGLSADNLTLTLAHDGSGVGAALVAAVMSAEQQQQQQL